MAAQGNGDAIGLASPGAFVLAQRAGLNQPLHVVVVALLRGAHLGFKAEHLGAVFAERAVHLRVAAHHLPHALQKGVDHQRVIAQVAGLHKVQLGVIGRHQLGVLADAAHQHTREEEIGKHHDASETELHGVAQAGLHQREGDA